MTDRFDVMTELRITVPDALADDVRELNLAVDAVGQRALLDSVAAQGCWAAAPVRGLTTYRATSG